ncbi:MAG: alpha/beta hydrolase [Pseudomonadota bacterium]
MYLNVDGQAAYAYTGARQPVEGQPSFVFVHGSGLDHTVWTMQARYFAHHGMNVYAVDLPGRGRSKGTPIDSISGCGDWIAKFCEAAGTGPALIAGHSMGSLVALEAVARHPGQFTGLALVGTAVPMSVADVLQDAADENRGEAYDMITIWGHSMAGQVGGGPHTPGVWLTGSSVRLLERGGPGVLGNDLRCCDEYRHGPESAAKVDVPTLLLLGQLDMMTPTRAARSLAEALPSVKQVVIDGCGHMLMAEQPDAVLDELIAFSESLHATA